MAAQQEFARIQLQLASAEEQIGTLSTAIDAVRAEAGNAIRELRDQMAAEQVRHNVLMQAVSRNGGTGRDWALISSNEESSLVPKPTTSGCGLRKSKFS